MMRVPTLALACLLTGLALTWSPRPIGAAPPPSSSQEPPFKIVPFEDGQLAIVLDRDVAASSQAAPGIKAASPGKTVLTGRIRRPAQCLCDPDTELDCTCDESDTWKVTVGKIRRPTNCSRPHSLLAADPCDPDTDPACTCDPSAAAWKVTIGEIRRPSTCRRPSPSRAVDLCDPDTDPGCTCDEAAAWNVIVGRIRRPSTCLCDPVQDPTCVCDDGGDDSARTQRPYN